MAYQVLARKYRPQLFSDVIGQDHVTRTLLNALSQNRIAHGYIFSGHRGIGKTTIARILAAALNCSTPVGTPDRPTQEPCRICVNCREISSASRQENSIFEESHSFDVEEIDAATNRGIDDARLLTTKIQTRPTNKSKYKIIILDEAHQITDAAWNALLKTLEEPPEWAVFMFATTQPEDIPQTIRSRCQHFSFHAVKLDDIVGQLRFISTRESITVDDATLTLLAEAGDGSMRDALSIMDQAIASAPLIDGKPVLEITQVRELMGSVSNVVYEQVLEAVHANNSADVLAIVGRLLDAGNGAPQLARQFVRYLRNTIVAKVTNLSPDTPATGIAADLLQISPEERARAARSAALFTEEELSRFLAIVLRTFDELGYRQEQRFHLELGLLKLVHVQRLVPIEELLSQLGAKPTSAPTTKPTTLSAVPTGTLSSRPEVSATISKATTPPPSPFELDRTRKTPAASSSTTLSTEGSLALAERPEPTPQPTIAAPQSNTRPHLVAAPIEAPAPIHAAPIHTEDIVASPITAPLASDNKVPKEVTDSRVPQEVTDSPVPQEVSDSPVPQGFSLGSHSSNKVEGALAPEKSSSELQSILISALASVKGQQSASEQLEDATLSLTADTLTIQTTLSKTMVPVILNAEAERILKAALRDSHPTPLKLVLLPGVAAPSTSPKKPRAATSGSAAELAEKHPLVQQARTLFSAEISNIIDLREKD
jgi:DNA polymerase-3 subunit gamma/tau